ncbi:hypothetical protein BH10BAC3_BH10BAC3_38800 [soil metagenome]
MLVRVDTLSSQEFLADKNLCGIVLANGFKEIRPQMVPWATDTSDPYSETYLIDGMKLKILQPLKRFDLPDSNRVYFYDGRLLNVVRVLFDSLKFNFNNVTIDYGYSAKNVFQNAKYVLLRNEPVAWSGLANRYRFIQLFDFKKAICYELFVDYYACLTIDH